MYFKSFNEFIKEDKIDYSEYVAENVHRNIGYSEYLAENLDKAIDYSMYISDNVDDNIKYSEYIAEKIDNNIAYIGGIRGMSGLIGPSGVAGTSGSVGASGIAGTSGSAGNWLSSYSKTHEKQLPIFLEGFEIKEFEKEPTPLNQFKDYFPDADFHLLNE